jgi:hypothetical protein
LHPKRIEQIAEHNLERDGIIRFSAFVRFEKEFTSPALCRKLADGGFLGGQAGLESGSERVNAIINKGTEMADIREIIRNFHKTGILLHIYSMVGLPGEHIEDSLMTRDFLKRRHGMIPLGWQIYPLGITELGPLAERAADFGLEVTPMPDEYLVQGTQYRLNDGLSQSESMAMAISIAEELKKYMHPVSRFMDVESHKLFLMAKKSRELSQDDTA